MKYKRTTNANTKDVAEHSEQKLDCSYIRRGFTEQWKKWQLLDSEFRQEAALKSYSKACKGGEIEGDRKERAAQERISDQPNGPTARKYVSERTVCTYRGANVVE